jgi:hypothetical protein
MGMILMSFDPKAAMMSSTVWTGNVDQISIVMADQHAVLSFVLTN